MCDRSASCVCSCSGPAQTRNICSSLLWAREPAASGGDTTAVWAIQPASHRLSLPVVLQETLLITLLQLFCWSVFANSQRHTELNTSLSPSSSDGVLSPVSQKCIFHTRWLISYYASPDGYTDCLSFCSHVAVLLLSVGVELGLVSWEKGKFGSSVCTQYTWMRASRCAWIRIMILILCVSTTVFIAQGNYIGYMFRLFNSHLQAYSLQLSHRFRSHIGIPACLHQWNT